MQNINVNIVPDNFPQTIRYSQGDIGRQFKINVTDFEIPNGATVKIQATKPSGFGFSVAGVVADNSVTFTTTAEMTDEAGRFQAELQITAGDDIIGTANFLMIGERNPHPEGTTDGSQGTIIPELTLLVERVEAAASSVLDMEVVANTLPAGSQATYSYDEALNKATFGIPEGQAGAGAAGVVASAYSAAKTYKVGDYVLYNSNLYRCTTAITTAEAWTAAHWTQVVLADDVTDLKSDFQYMMAEVFSNDAKAALLKIAEKVAYIDTNGQSYYNDLEDALNPVTAISCTFTQGAAVVYNTDSLDSLRSMLVVIATFANGETGRVYDYKLSGTLDVGTSTITVSCGGETDTFTVTVTQAPYVFYDYINESWGANPYPSNCGILTDIELSSSMTLETELLFTNGSRTFSCPVMGVRDGQSGTKQFGLFITSDNGKMGYWYGGTDTTVTSYPFTTANALYTVKVQPVGGSATYPLYATINVNGTDYSTGSTATGETWEPWLGFFKYGISATNTSGNNDYAFGLHIGRTIIKDSSNNIVHDIRPAYSNALEVYGLYDTIGDKFYYNSTYSDKYSCGDWS